MNSEILNKKIYDLLFDLRKNMTSVTRYVRHNRQEHPGLTDGQFLDQDQEYKVLALKSVDNILKCINDDNEISRMIRDDTKAHGTDCVTMNDNLNCNKIVKTLAYCKNSDLRDHCNQCPFNGSEHCLDMLFDTVIDLLCRQKAEIEALKCKEE